MISGMMLLATSMTLGGLPKNLSTCIASCRNNLASRIIRIMHNARDDTASTSYWMYDYLGFLMRIQIDKFFNPYTGVDHPKWLQQIVGGDCNGSVVPFIVKDCAGALLEDHPRDLKGFET